MTATKRRRLGIAGLGMSFALALSGCAGFGNLGNAPGVTTITLATVNNPQMQDMAQLLPEFNKLHPDIKINMIFMEENDLRNAATKDVATEGGQYDIMTVGAYEVPIWGQNRWLVDLTDMAAEDPAYDVDDFFKPVRDGVSFEDRLYAVPFYGESSFLMYRKDLFEQAGLDHAGAADLGAGRRVRRAAEGPGRGPGRDLPARQAGLGRDVRAADHDRQHLRRPVVRHGLGRPGELAGFNEAVQFYLDTAGRIRGRPTRSSFGFTECLNLFSQERAAMWYDATSAAGSVESSYSKVAGKVGYVRAPVKETTDSGWLWSWNLGINAESDSTRTQAWEFVKWATSKEYAEAGRLRRSAGRRPRPAPGKSTYQIPEYIEAGGEFAPLTAEIMNEVDPKQAGRQPAAVGRHPVRDHPGVPRRRQPDLPARRRRHRRPKTARLALDQGQKNRPASRRATTEGGLMSTTVGTDPDAVDKPRAAAPAGRPHTGPSSRARTSPSGKFARKLILPGLVVAILITQIPFLATIYYSFQDWNLARPEERSFAGFDNYVAVITNGAVPALDLGDHPHRRRLDDPVAAARPAACRAAGPEVPRARPLARTLLITPFLVMPAAAALIWKYSLLEVNTGMVNWGLGLVRHRPGSPGTPTTRADHRVHPDLAVHAVHDVDPAGRAAVPGR